MDGMTNNMIMDGVLLKVTIQGVKQSVIQAAETLYQRAPILKQLQRMVKQQK